MPLSTKVKVQKSAPKVSKPKLVNRVAAHLNGLHAASQKGESAVLAALPEALQKEIAAIQPKVASLSENNLETRHEIGSKLLEIVQDTSGKYGADPLKAMQKVMPLSKDGLRPMLELARRFDRADLDKLTGLRHPETNEHLNYSHVMALTRVKDKQKIFDLAEKAVTSGWTSKELNREIIRVHGGPRSKGGRKQAKPTTFAAVQTDVINKLTTIENAIDMWAGPGGFADLFETLAAQPGWKPDAALADQAGRAMDRLISATFKLTAFQQTVNSVKHRVDAARKSKPAA